ncbi:hypothetical protein ACRN9C_05165 [Shewanella frigidimarina]|uniref:hypothetical protein n=1 Tax=Shewanella TaxID=22 RepID=UPI002175709D|nr:hypothetical protein [Shewanella sp. SG44-2]
MKFFKAIRLNILTSRIRLMMTGCRNNRSLAIAGVLVPRILISVCLVSGLLQSNRVLANDIPQSCQRSFNYSIYLSGLHTGEMSRTENWQGKSAVIISKSEASILGIGTQYQQRTELSWSNNSNEWLTDSFHQQVTGFRSRDMQATFYNNGLESRVDIDGDIENYTSSQIPLRDVDTLAIQIRENLLGGRRQFALIRQASDAIEPYQFYVKDKLITTIGSWGEIQLIPVEQTGAEEVTYYFAPSMNYQLVKAHYHGMILQGVIELDRYVSSCDTMSES